MIVYRCTLKKWKDDLSGNGAFLYGGRWNNPGTHLLYTAENNILAALEIALRIPLQEISENYIMVPIQIPKSAELSIPKLRSNWNTDLAYTKQIGDHFVKEEKHLLMKVPSALISDAFNYLINPLHPMAKELKVGPTRPILFDKRLLQIVKPGSE